MAPFVVLPQIESSIMGRESFTYVMLGIALDEAEACVERRVRGCSHEETTSKFCGECGKITWSVTQELRYMPSVFSQDDGPNPVVGFLPFKTHIIKHKTVGVVGAMLGCVGTYTQHAMTLPARPEGIEAKIEQFCREQNIPYDKAKLELHVLYSEPIG